MVESGGHQSSKQRPNLWEELNRPRVDEPAPSTPTEPEISTLVEDEPTPVPPSPAAVVMKRIDSQYLLVVGGLLFVVVAVVALRGLGGSSESSTTADTSSPSTVPERLPAIAESTTIPPAPTSQPEESGPTAMGLPARLLDGPQSSVYRLYRTSLGRDPDRAGFQFWADQVRSGTPLERLAEEFLASDEFRLQFADTASADERTLLLIGNAFGPAEDDQQLKAWLGRYRDLQGAALLLAISEADETLAQTGTLR